MLLTLSLILLLTPFPSLQTTTNEKRTSTGSDMSKPNVILALSKPKTTVTLAKQVKQTPRPDPKANVINHLLPSTSATSQKPPTAVKNTKDKSTQTVLSTAQKSANQTVIIKINKDKTASVVNKPAIQSTQSKPTTVSGVSTTKERPAPAQPIKVVISDGCDSNHTKEQEVKLKPGAPLVMTHKISLVPGGCTGGCVAEMAALKGRVARLEKEMATLKQKCPCSANCANDCNGNGKCEMGKCVCFQGFLGPHCSKCALGADCSKKGTKENVRVTVETVTLQVNQESNSMKENTKGKKTKADQAVLQRKEQGRGAESKDFSTKTKVTTNTGVVKTVVKQGTTGKTTIRGSVTGTKTSHPTVGQVLLKHGGRKQEEARKGKTTVLSANKLPKTDLKIRDSVKEGVAGRTVTKVGQFKDQYHGNVTQGTTRVVTLLVTLTSNKTRPGKETLGQSTLAEKNVTQSSGKKVIKKVKIESANATKVVQSTDNTATIMAKTASGKGKIAHKSQYIVNVTTDGSQVSQTSAQQSRDTTRRTGGSGLGSVRVENITSYSFTLTWLAPQGMFKNFSVTRREYRADDEEEDDVEVDDGTFERDGKTKNITEVHAHTESSNGTTSTPKVSVTRGKAESRIVSMVLPGNVRSVEFSNLQPQTRYVMHVFGTGPGRRSKIHRVAVMTGPEPVTELVFSNVTESSLTVSWSKPKSAFTGITITYTNIVTGERRFVTVHTQQSYLVLSRLSAGTSYSISVTTMQSKIHSDAITSSITTVPAPPTHLQVTNVTDTRAVLQWTPSLGKVDRFIISYESSKTPNVTVTVMVSGSSVEQQLRGLQRGTLYTVKILSQKDSLQSTSISTTFTTANVVKANEVGARSAVITWRTQTVVYHSYRLIYQVVGEETKEVILDPTVTEYKLTGLIPMSRYIVLVQGERAGQYTSVVTTEFITGKLRFPFPTECSQELLNGALKSGEVDIYPWGKEGGAVRVYCDMETDGGGWTVFQRRMNGKTDFYRTWEDYRVGFGNHSEEFWLGNELLHNLTSMGLVSLRVDMQAGNDTVYAVYSNFTIDSEENHYAIMLSGYTGTAGDSMRYHNGRSFSTRDKDPNPLGIHCARAYMGGWWYKNCYKTNLNGLYGMNSNNQGVVWIDWKGKDFSIPFTEMKIRPAGFSPMTHG